MTPFFPLFFPLYLFVTFVFVFKYSQSSCQISCGPTFGSFWFLKYLNFGQKVPIRIAHYTFLERRHPEVLKNLHYVLFPDERQKKVSAYGL